MIPKSPRETLQQMGSVLATLPRAGWMALQEAPGYSLLLVVTHVLEGILPLITIWAGKIVIDSVVGMSGGDVDFDGALRTLGPVLLLYLILTVIGEVGAAFSGISGQVMCDRILARANTMLMEKIAHLPDLTPFETSEFHDELRNAREGIDNRPFRVVHSFLFLISFGATCMAAAAMLWQFEPLILLIVIAAIVPSTRLSMKLFERMAQIFRGQATDARLLRYLARLATGDETAKEVRLYGLGPYFTRRYRSTLERMFGEMIPHVRRFSTRAPLVNLLEEAVIAVAYVMIVQRAIRGELTVGEMTMYLGTIGLFQGSVGMFLGNLSEGYINGLYLRHFFDFIERSPSIKMAEPEQARSVPSQLQQGIELRHVSFQYPGTHRMILRDLDLHIRPGETVALVGENGSGKTTLVKLLTRLFDPTDGEILLDDRDIREYDLDDLRRNTTAIFQDYCHYHMTARDNVALGGIGKRDDLDAIRTAAERGQAAPLIESLPSGYETMLGRRFEGGVDLSGGEWQKIALSRAFMRDAQILILDEPSAALDVETEYEIYLHSAELTRDRTTLLISHRFTTVRMADRIVVLDQGGIIEDGSHEELMQRGGLYSEMFTAQARRYAE
ncbi:MAG: ABC transporter ATP-binding protein [Gemmatimonadetes bacterium]|jgi:ATP-binding cassette, subfamily B, bacterial|nr:ABC transporter ATP-binding protein [Gemmatimonadota bacterium]